MPADCPPVPAQQARPFTWVPQMDPKRDTQCGRCQKSILRGELYWRAAFDLDGIDPHGADFCARCKQDATSTT